MTLMDDYKIYKICSCSNEWIELTVFLKVLMQLSKSRIILYDWNLSISK